VKHIDQGVLRASFVASWAAELQALQTQTKETEEKTLLLSCK